MNMLSINRAIWPVIYVSPTTQLRPEFMGKQLCISGLYISNAPRNLEQNHFDSKGIRKT